MVKRIKRTVLFRFKKRIKMKLRQTSYRKERNERLNPHNLRHTTQRIIRVINKRILKVTKELKVYLWEKCRVVKGYDKTIFRIDRMNNLIQRDKYGCTGKFGWQIDHKRPISKYGTNKRMNIQALQSSANIRKGNIYPFKYPNLKNFPVNV